MKKRAEVFPRPAKTHVALVAVWAAVTAGAQVIPTIPMLGTGRSFSFATALAPLAGIFFGPLAGALCAAAGGFVGSLLAPHTAWMGPGTFIIGTVTAFTAGCIAWGRWPPVRISGNGSFVINGGIIVFLLGTVLWFSHETGRGLARFPLVFYGAGFAALLVGSAFACNILAGKNRALKFPALMLCAFGGMAGGASVGNFFGLVLFDFPREMWMVLTFTAPIERLVFSVGTALVGLPLLASLPKIGIFIGPQKDDEAPSGEGGTILEKD
ncbi:MAG: ECF transporter S component [Treponema sp.]|nr:ECF transporter S component [Treponema sp.]